MGVIITYVVELLVSNMSEDIKELPENPSDYAELQQLTSSLAIAVPAKTKFDMTGKNYSCSCDFLGMKKLDFSFGEKLSLLNITMEDNRVISWQIGEDDYLINEFQDLKNNHRKFGIVGHAIGENEYEIVAFDLNNCYRTSYCCKFENGQVTVKRSLALTLLNPAWTSDLQGKIL
jgi:hypothetical protein